MLDYLCIIRIYFIFFYSIVTSFVLSALSLPVIACLINSLMKTVLRILIRMLHLSVCSDLILRILTNHSMKLD